MIRTRQNSGLSIFAERAIKKQQVRTVSPKKHNFGLFFKSAGVVTSMAVLFFGINYSTAGIQKVDKQVVDPASTLPQGTTFMNMVPQVQTPSFNTVQPAAVVPAVNTPATFVPNAGTGFINTPNFNTPTFTPVANPVQAGPNGGDLVGAANQINQLNTQIVQQMQVCVQLTVSAQSQINQIKGQVQQMDAAIQQLNAAMNAINYQDPNAQAQRYQIQAQRDQIQFQKNQANSAISQIRSQYYSQKSQCQNAVFRAQSQKRTLESQLNTAFNSALNVSIY